MAFHCPVSLCVCLTDDGSGIRMLLEGGETLMKSGLLSHCKNINMSTFRNTMAACPDTQGMRRLVVGARSSRGLSLLAEARGTARRPVAGSFRGL
jgi:hypothetical protein